tara:strand:- start:510 stop:914 length:405 start_codon:yes stop_codon:yes gene_type:complete
MTDVFPLDLTRNVREYSKQDTVATRRKDAKIAEARKNIEALLQLKNNNPEKWDDNHEKMLKKNTTWIKMVDACKRTARLKEELADTISCSVVWAPYFHEERQERIEEEMAAFNDAVDQLSRRRRWRERPNASAR